VSEFHSSVLAEQLTAVIVPAISAVEDAVVVDATCGAGGHTAGILEHAAPSRVILLDRDQAALAFARTRLAGAPCPLEFRHARFSSLATVLDELGVVEVAALIADIGVSSHQFDAGERGFSFRTDAPLDMRMDPTSGETAAQLIARLDAVALANLLRRYGEEPEARRVAEAIVRAKPTTTGELASVVEESMSGHARRTLGKRIHPATRTFQALRIVVNAELEELETLLEVGPSRLAVGGRMAVISFHSLEDRMVKRRFTKLCQPPPIPRGLPMTAAEMPQPSYRIPAGVPRKGIEADAAELDRNPRSRSARLRVIERVSP
jgi:16S rRNA (cytosine1402-N4)-methyltransferase